MKYFEFGITSDRVPNRIGDCPKKLAASLVSAFPDDRVPKRVGDETGELPLAVVYPFPDDRVPKQVGDCLH